MFAGIKKLFKKEEKQPEMTKLKFDNLFAYYEDRVEEKRKEFILEAKSSRERIESLIDSLLEDLGSLKNKKIPEERAKSSEDIKTRFCERSISILDSTSSDIKSREISNSQQVEDFCYYLKRNISKIDLSPKEMMHLKFFFSEEMASIVKKINEIGRIIDVLNKRLTSGFVAENKNTQKHFEYIKTHEKEINEWNEKLTELSKELRNMEIKKDSISLLDVSELSSVRSDIKHLDTRFSYIKQQINSEFGGVSRIFKRIYHNEENDLIIGYINSPYEAFVKDEDCKIRTVIIDTLVRIKDGKADIDKKSLKKLETLMDKLDELVDYKKEAAGIEEKINSVKDIEKNLSEKEDINRKAKKELVDMEKSISACKLSQDKIKESIEKARLKITEEKRRVVSTISTLLNENIIIVD